MVPRVLHLFSKIIFLFLINTNPALSCHKAIFSFGDSLTDTGNYLYIDANDPVGRYPYGSTYFHHPTGRYSDGRIILDFIASEFGLPMVRPYLPAADSGNSFRYGANFAVGGATAVNNIYFRERGFKVTWTEYSLGAQIRQFRQLLALMSSSGTDSTDTLSKSLVLIGEIGGNDYFHFIEQNRTAELKAMVPTVIKSISSAINSMIELGAITIVVPGLPALGCTALLLTMLGNTREEEYDRQTGCIKLVNEFVEYHNYRLQDELDRIRNRNPNVTIIYADYYTIVLSLYQSPKKFGFEVSLPACCGGPGPYNTDIGILCGNEGSSVCSDPSVHISWDGTHYTEAVYKIMARGILEGPYAAPPLKHTCSLILANFSDIQ